MATYVRILTSAVLYVWVSQFAVLTAIQRPGNSYAKARLTDLVDGTGYKPFVLRTLLPSTVRLVLMATPEGIQRRVHAAVHDSGLFRATPAPDEENGFLYLVAYVLEGISLLGWLGLLRAGLIHFYGDRGLLTDVLPGLAGMLLPCLYRYVHYDYDFPQLFVFTWALLLLCQRNWLRFYPVLLLAALSKETALLLVLAHLLAHYSNMSRQSWLAHAAIQAGIVLAVRALLQFVVFRNNPGTDVEVWFERNLAFITEPEKVFRLLFWIAPVGGYSVYLPTSCNVLFLLGVPPLIWRWAEKPLALRRSFLLFPLLVVLTLVMGQVDEIRVYYEVVPILFWLVAHTALSRPSEPRP